MYLQLKANQEDELTSSFFFLSENLSILTVFVPMLFLKKSTHIIQKLEIKVWVSNGT